MGRELWAVGFKRCAARHCVVIGASRLALRAAFGACRCARPLAPGAARGFWGRAASSVVILFFVIPDLIRALSRKCVTRGNFCFVILKWYNKGKF